MDLLAEFLHACCIREYILKAKKILFPHLQKGCAMKIYSDYVSWEVKRGRLLPVLKFLPQSKAHQH